MVVVANSFFLLSVHSVPPQDIMQASNTRTETRMAAFWVSSFLFLSLSLGASSEHYGFGGKGNRGGSIWLSAGFVGFGCCHESMFDTKTLYFYRALLLDWLAGGKGTVLNQGRGGEGGGGRGILGYGGTWGEEQEEVGGHMCMYENQG